MRKLIFVNFAPERLKIFPKNTVNKDEIYQGSTMEVSRIEAAPTKIIDWRRLTAKEIIKYNNDGVEVPPQYLKWAIDFRQDLEKNDKDDITYEMAQQEKIDEKNKKIKSESDINTANRDQTINDESSAAETTSAIPTEDKEKDPQDMTAKERRQKLKDDGASIFKQGIIFMGESRERTQLAKDGKNEVEKAENQSDNEIAGVEAYMQNLLAEASEIKSKIDAAKSNKSSDAQAEIRRLRTQLRALGINAQSMLAGTDADIDNYQAIIEDNFTIGDDAIDYGNETVDIGDEIKRIPFYYPFGKYAERVGNRAVDAGDEVNAAATEADNINKSNKSRVSSLQNEVTIETGVGEASENIQKDKNKEDETANKNDPVNTIEANDADKIASGNLEQVVLAKLRRGQDVEA